MLNTIKDRKTLALLGAIVVSAIFGIQFAAAVLGSTATTTPLKTVNYGVSRVDAQITPAGSYSTITVNINATQGPIFLEQLQFNTPGFAASLGNMITNGHVHWNSHPTVVSCTGSGCYGELIGGIQGSGSEGTNSGVLVKDPLQNQAIGANTGSPTAQSLQVQILFPGPASGTVDVSAQIVGPSTAKITMSLTT